MMSDGESGSPSQELIAFKAALRAKYDLKEKAFVERNVEQIISQFYAPEAIEVGDGDPVQIGIDALRSEYERHIDDKVRIESYSAHVEGNSGWDWVNFHVTPKDPSVVPFVYAILFVWVRRNGEWLCLGGSYSRAEFDIPTQ